MAEWKIGVVGCAGRMGQMLVREIVATKGAAFVAGSEAAGHPALGRDAGELAGVGALKVRVGADPAAVFKLADAVIDFTSPAASVKHAALAAAMAKIGRASCRERVYVLV